MADAARLSFVFTDVAPIDDNRDDITLDVLMPVGDGAFERINRSKVLSGPLPQPDRTDEATISSVASERYGIGVGDTVTIDFFRPDQLAEVFGGNPAEPGGPWITFRIVAVVVTATEVLATSPIRTPSTPPPPSGASTQTRSPPSRLRCTGSSEVRPT